MNITRDINKLRNYFRIYNEQIKQIPGISGFYEIDVSGELDSIVESVYDPRRLEEQSFLGNNWTCRSRNEFSIEVLLYFIKTGNVPEYNINEIVESAKEKLPFPIGRSFEKFARQLREIRKKDS
jgi:hypothetical protein